MRRGTRVVFGALVVVVAASVVYLLTDETGEARSAASPVETPPAASTSGMELPEALPSAERAAGEVRPLEAPAAVLAAHDPSTDATSAPAPARISGRVTHALDGRPAAGERLIVLWEPANPEAERLAHPEVEAGSMTRAEMRSAMRDLGVEAFETTTDEDGRYSFTLPGVVRTTVRFSGIEVAAGPTTPRQVARDQRELPPGTEAVFDIALHAGSVLSGTVVDRTGRPVPGASVDGSTILYGVHQRENDTPDRSVITDGSGAFTIGAMGEEFSLSASADGLVPHLRIKGRLPLDETAEGLELMVSVERELVGTVIDSGGVPLPDVSITLTSEIPTAQRVTHIEGIFGAGPPPAAVTSDQDGRFRLDGLCQRTYRVRTQHPDYQEWAGAHGPKDGELSIQLTAGLRLTGNVSSPDGTPLAGARVRMGSGDDMSANTGFSRTDEDGRFVFEGLSPDVNAFVVARADGREVHVEQPVTLEEGVDNHVELVLRPERVLAGVVVDARGEPLEDVVVTIEGDRLVDYGNVTMFPKPTWESQFGSVNTTTGPSGVFRIGNLYDGMFRITATSPDDELRAVLDARSGIEDLRVVLDPGATVGVTLTGIARDGLTGLPLQDEFYVTPMLGSRSGGYSGTGNAFQNPEGRYRITALDEGPILLNASADGYAPWSGGAHTLENGEHRFDIAFLPNRRVEFHVVDGNGEPVSVNLGFVDEQGESLMVEHGPGSRASSLTTDEKGQAIAGGLPAARITVNAKRGWLGPRREYVVDLRPEPSGPIELIYGQQEMRTLLVLVLTGAPTEPEPVGQPGWKIGSWLEEQVEGGHLRPMDTPVQVSATDEGGLEVASTQLDPAGENAQAFPIKGVELPFVSKLELPAEPLSIRAAAEGHSPATRAWDPAASIEIMVLVLTPE